MSKQADHLSYVLHLWRAREDGETVWRAALLVVPADSWIGFGTLSELCDYVRRQTVDRGASASDGERMAEV